MIDTKDICFATHQFAGELSTFRPSYYLPRNITQATLFFYPSTLLFLSFSPNIQSMIWPKVVISWSNRALTRWHQILGLKRYSSRTWHVERLREEREELRLAPTAILQVSEKSDVYFTISRAKCEGNMINELPAVTTWRRALVYAYMFSKFTSRKAFFRVVARLHGGRRQHRVREVVNPKMDSKLRVVAERHRLDTDKFVRIGQRLRYVWPLLP